MYELIEDLSAATRKLIGCCFVFFHALLMVPILFVSVIVCVFAPLSREKNLELETFPNKHPQKDQQFHWHNFSSYSCPPFCAHDCVTGKVTVTIV